MALSILLRIIKGDPDLLLPGESEHEIIGTIVVGLTGCQRMVYQLAVVELNQYKGVGYRLISEAKTRYRQRVT